MNNPNGAGYRPETEDIPADLYKKELEIKT